MYTRKFTPGESRKQQNSAVFVSDLRPDTKPYTRSVHDRRRDGGSTAVGTSAEMHLDGATAGIAPLPAQTRPPGGWDLPPLGVAILQVVEPNLQVVRELDTVA